MKGKTEAMEEQNKTVYRIRMEKWKNYEQEIARMENKKRVDIALLYRAYLSQMRMYGLLIKSKIVPVPQGIPEHIVEYKRKINSLFRPADSNRQERK